MKPMSSKEIKVVNDIATFFEAALIELPAAAAKRLLSEEKDDKALYAAGWKAYDAFVRIANESANQLYANPAFGQMAAQTLEKKVLRLGVAVAIFQQLAALVGVIHHRPLVIGVGGRGQGGARNAGGERGGEDRYGFQPGREHRVSLA